jgi:hypothetical protein
LRLEQLVASLADATVVQDDVELASIDPDTRNLVSQVIHEPEETRSSPSCRILGASDASLDVRAREKVDDPPELAVPGPCAPPFRVRTKPAAHSLAWMTVFSSSAMTVHSSQRGSCTTI